MPIDSGKMVTFEDMQFLIDFEGFTRKDHFVATKNAATKAEISANLSLDESAAEWISWPSNKLVPRRLLVPETFYWVGIAPVCEQYDASDTPPTTPTLTVGAVTTSSIYVSWTASTDDNSVLGYELQIATDSGFTNIIKTISQTWLTREYTATLLQSSTTYYFRVRAYDNVGQPSSWSTTQSGTTSTPAGGLDTLEWTEDDMLWEVGESYWESIKAEAGTELVVRVTINSNTGSGVKWRIHNAENDEEFESGTADWTIQSVGIPELGHSRATVGQLFLRTPTADASISVTLTVLSATGYSAGDFPSPITINKTYIH